MYYDEEIETATALEDMEIDKIELTDEGVLIYTNGAVAFTLTYNELLVLNNHANKRALKKLLS
jgi:hypothetical protein